MLTKIQRRELDKFMAEKRSQRRWRRFEAALQLATILVISGEVIAIVYMTVIW